MEDMMMRPGLIALALGLLAFAAAVSSASAQIAVSGNDNKVLLVNGVVTVVQNPPADTVSIIDLKASPPRVIGDVPAPVSAAGPPLTAAVRPDESLAIGNATNTADPSDPNTHAPNKQGTSVVHERRPP